MNRPESWLGPISIALILLTTACAGSVTTSCPPPVWMDKPVGEELQNIPYEGFEDTWSWIARVNKLNLALETCQP